MENFMAEYERWASSEKVDASLRAGLDAMKGDVPAIKDAFYAPLSFGTAGLRGTMGPGINRMNVHTVAQATQGLASLIIDNGEDACRRGVAIAYDCRINSELFSRVAASVLAANGINTFLFDELRPTPELSYAIRELHCIAGINITASHNPKEYNGYKAYWEDGAQLPPKEASVVSEYIGKTDIFDGIKTTDFDAAVADGKIKYLGSETDEKFLAEVLACSIDRESVAEVADEMKLVYTPFHGAGYRLVPEALRRLGFKNIITVPSQMKLDGTFPTVKSPNPENKEGFAEAIELARANDVDLIIGTDPDSDRVGIVLRDSGGEYVSLTGNQVGALLLHYIITARKERSDLPLHSAAVKTIVTTEMARAICAYHGVKLYECFTGFKFIAEKMNDMLARGETFLLGFEESYGYTCGTHVRDKDAVGASVMIAEMAAHYRKLGMTLYDAMTECYKIYGYYSESTINLVMPGLDGLEKMAALMSGLRENPPKTLGSQKVAAYVDYKTGIRTSFSDGTKTQLELKDSNVLSFELADGTRFIVRPSGTEPKVKIYILASGASKPDADAKVAELAKVKL